MTFRLSGQSHPVDVRARCRTGVISVVASVSNGDPTDNWSRVPGAGVDKRTTNRSFDQATWPHHRRIRVARRRTRPCYHRGGQTFGGSGGVEL